MKVFLNSHLFLVLLFFAFSCKEPEILPDPDPLVNSSLDELVDKTEYPEGMIVDTRSYGGKKVYRVYLNDQEHVDPLSLDLSMAGYYHLDIHTDAACKDPQVIRLAVIHADRGETEWGLPPWTPAGLVYTQIGSQDVQTIYPSSIPGNRPVPLLVLIDGPPGSSQDNLIGQAGGSTFHIKRGTGSCWIDPGQLSASALQIDHRSFPVQPAVYSEAPLALGGDLTSDMELAPGSYAHIGEDLRIPQGLRLSIGAGSYISVAPQVNILLEGELVISGLEDDPVTVTCSEGDAFWGGIIGEGEGNLVDAVNTIFCRSGYHTGSEYNWGHAQRQALFFSRGGSISLESCYIFDHIGQVLYTEYADLEMYSCLVQGAITGGQLNYTQIDLDQCVFTDFPDDELVYSDSDNDALYLVECTGLIDHSIFMFARDDGLDSGSGGEGGNVSIRNSRFESVFHEGAALSGGSAGASKIHKFTNCVFTDCGQGLELGFSSKSHYVAVDSCTFQSNGVGVRYGDNYPWGNNGLLEIADSYSLNNSYHDVWNMDREDWVADTASMIFNNVWVSMENPMYPELNIYEE